MKKIISAIVISTLAIRALAGSIYVSPTGSDSNAGTESQPLATVAQAFKQAREWRRLGAPESKEAITIYLAPGTYAQSKPIFVRPEDSGTKDAPTIVTTLGQNPAVISGGVAVTGWKKGTDNPKIPASIRSRVWVAEAPREGNRLVETRQLWVNGRKALRATQFGDGKMERMIDFNPSERTITIPTPAQDLSDAGQLEMLVHQRWAIAILRVKEMKKDAAGNTVVSFHDPESQLEFAHPWPQPVIGGERGNSSFSLGNALELLDEPGEWFQEYPSGKIYYLPEEETVDMNSAEAVVPVLETIMAVEGTRERRVHDLTFRNVSFEYSSWLRPSREGHVTLQGGFQLIDAYKLQVPGLPEKAELENQAWIARPEAAVTVRFSDEVNFIDCRFSHLANTGLDYTEADKYCRVEACRFEDIGGTALQIGTFPDRGFETHVPYIPGVPADLCSNILVKGNTVTDATNEDWGAVGIGAGYVADLAVIDNEVSDVNYSGICVGWGWTPLESGMKNNRIEGNYVHHFAKQLYDAGGIYTLSNQPGSYIVNNRIEDLVDAPYATNHRAFYIYFDEATDGFTVENNLCPNPEFGYNRPGPALIVRNNGPEVKLPQRKRF